MDRVISAIEAGRCAMAVSGSLLNDADVMLALRERADLPAMALSGPVQAPVRAIGADAVQRAVAQPGGVVVLVDPQLQDQTGLQQLAGLLHKGPHTPTVLVVAHGYNPLLYQSLFRGIAVAHLKGRGKQFLVGLPKPPAGMAPVVAETKKAVKAPEASGARLVFVGRDEDLPALAGLLGTGGPVVVHGPSGVGKSLLVEQAIAAAGLKRLPDFSLGWGAGFDALIARIAEACNVAGADGLVQAINAGAKPGERVSAAISTLQGASGLDGHVWVIRDLQHGIGRDGDLFRKSRLEILLQALLTQSYPLRIVFLSTRVPQFYRHGAQGALRLFPVEGIKGRFFHEIFSAYRSPEFPREAFGPISERVHGHPLAAREYAIAIRTQPDGLDLVENTKFLASESLGDIGPLKKVIAKRVEALQGEDRDALSRCAHLRTPVAGQVLADLGVGRKARLALLADGFLDIVGTEQDRRYRVHPLVRAALSLREVSDFDLLGKVFEVYQKVAKESSGVEKLAALQEANRCAVEARHGEHRSKLLGPDNDSVLESIAGMIRSQKPNLGLAEQRLKEVLGQDPTNSDAWVLRCEWMEATNAEQKAIEAVWDEAIVAAPVPEVFHRATSWLLDRRARNKAISVLETAVAAFPDESRLKTRLAAVLMRQGRRKEAIELLRAAMELDPMLPDAYGLLGMARREEGPEALSEAENLLREAVRLAPEDPTQVPRLVSLLVARARVENEHRDALRAEARELLERITRGDRKTPEGFLLLAQIVREDGAEIERAEWLLDKARKLTDRAHERMFRVRLEKALLDAAHGKLIDAEAGIRELGKKDPSNAEVFVALAQVLWQQDQVIPAHAELMRAQSRCAPGSLERAYIDRKLTELQALIEAQAAGLMDAGSEDGSVLPVPINAAGHNRVIRRRKGDEEPQAATSEQPTGVTLMPVEPPLSPPSEVEGEKAPSSEADAHHH